VCSTHAKSVHLATRRLRYRPEEGIVSSSEKKKRKGERRVGLQKLMRRLADHVEVGKKITHHTQSQGLLGKKREVCRGMLGLSPRSGGNSFWKEGAVVEKGRSQKS